MGSIMLFHGSSQVIEKPKWGAGKDYNDYGRGFYCTKELELAKEWACTEGVDGYANRYELDMDSLNVLYLNEGSYTILHWLALLVHYRQFRLSTPMMREAANWLEDNYLLDISFYDVIVGYRADDSYFSFARAFLSNQISLQQLEYAMRLGELGEQYVLKSQKAFEDIRFLSYEVSENSHYFTLRRRRDELAREAYQQAIQEQSLEGVYIRDLIREKQEV